MESWAPIFCSQLVNAFLSFINYSLQKACYYFPSGLLLFLRNRIPQGRTELKNNNINNNASLKSPYPQKNVLLKKKKTTSGKPFPL